MNSVFRSAYSVLTDSRQMLSRVPSALSSSVVYLIATYLFTSFLLFYPANLLYGQTSSTNAGIRERAVSAWSERALNRIHNPPLGLPKTTPGLNSLLTPDLILLGKELFFDTRLSVSNELSCASCHVPAETFTQNGIRKVIGRNGLPLRRNTPTLLNAVYYEHLFLDGRETTLETLIISPLTHPNEMANPSVGWLLNKLNRVGDYKQMFERLFGRPEPTINDLGVALGAFQRSLISGNSRFDRWYYSDNRTLFSAEEAKGFMLFSGKADCQSCHQIGQRAALFTDQAFHDTGLMWKRQTKGHTDQSSPADLGRFEVTNDVFDKWRVRTPNLRNIELTAPYMHDGSFESLTDVLEFYNDGGAPHPGQDVRIRPLNLSKSEIASIVSFLKTLTSDDLEPLSSIEETKY